MRWWIHFVSNVLTIILFFILLGVCLVLLLSGEDAINTVSEFVYQNNRFGSESVYIGNDGNQVRQLTDMIFDPKMSGAGMWNQKKKAQEKIKRKKSWLQEGNGWEGN